MIIIAKLAQERIGTIRKNNYGTVMEVVGYGGSNDIWVKFGQGSPVHTSWDAFSKGVVKNVYDRTVFGVGYKGEGEYKTSINGIHPPRYRAWQDMIQRCYDKKHHKTHPSYVGCTVADEWHNFQTFAKWYDENIYKIEGEKLQLDKDILVKGNRIYSPETCIFAPKRINLLFIKNDAKRGKFPIGVMYEETSKKFTASCNINNKIYTKSFNSIQEAFQEYKTVKEKYIKLVAEEYKDKIPERLYYAMLRYEIEITD